MLKLTSCSGMTLNGASTACQITIVSCDAIAFLSTTWLRVFRNSSIQTTSRMGGFWIHRNGFVNYMCVFLFFIAAKVFCFEQVDNLFGKILHKHFLVILARTEPKPCCEIRGLACLYRLSLAISAGTNNSRLTHSHRNQYQYVLQSLTLWREVRN